MTPGCDVLFRESLIRRKENLKVSAVMQGMGLNAIILEGCCCRILRSQGMSLVTRGDHHEEFVDTKYSIDHFLTGLTLEGNSS